MIPFLIFLYVKMLRSVYRRSLELRAVVWTLLHWYTVSNNPTESGSIGNSRAARVKMSYDPVICNTALRFPSSKHFPYSPPLGFFSFHCVLVEAIFAFLAQRAHVFVLHFLNPVRFHFQGSKYNINLDSS